MKKKHEKLLILLVDGFNGVLALMIYNFLLYMSLFMNGVVKRIREETGYFYINTFKGFGTAGNSLKAEVMIVLLFAFLLGIIIGNIVRRIKKVNF